MSIADIMPGLKVEVGFGVDAVGGSFFVLDDPVKGELDNATYLLAPDTVMVDLTSQVAAVSTKRGGDRELDEYVAGSASIVFNDNDRTLDPSYSGSPYAGEIVPLKRIHVSYLTASLFSGWVMDWSVEYEPGDNLSRVTAECQDGFAILANQELSEIASAHTGDTTGERIDRVLNRAEVDFPASRDIDEGTSVLGNTTLGENALAYLQACARAEAGYLFVNAGGVLTFRNRLTTLNVPSGATFTDVPADGIPYRNVQQSSAADLLYTRVTGTSETTDVEVVSTNTAAADQFLVRTLSLGTLLSIDDDEVGNLTDYYLNRFSSVEPRFRAATINVAALTAEQAATVAGLDITDVVTVKRTPLGIGDELERVSMVNGISHSIAHGKWECSLSFANVDTRAFLTLDDETFGYLDTNRLAF